MPTRKASDPARRVFDYIIDHKLVSRGEKLVVAVSGGPDSICLLYILLELREQLGISLHVAHLDHRLRGADSAADAVYVTRLARRLGLPATVESSDVDAYRKERRLSLEEAAREVRYSFLARVAISVGAARVGVGHTADDHIETVLMHLLRGSGARGLRGLLPVSRWRSEGLDLTVIRPLLEMTRAETAAYCRARRLKPRIDASNLSAELFRNRVRHFLVPELRKYNPRVDEALRRTAAIAADDLAFMEREVGRLWPGIVTERNGALIIDKKGLIALPPALKRYLLRRGVETAVGSLKDIEAGHIEDLLEALEKPSGRVIVLPFGITFTIEHDRFLLAKDPASLYPYPALDGETALKIPGETRLPGWTIEAAVLSPSEVEVAALKDGSLFAYLDFARAGSRLFVRAPRPADRFQPLGMSGVKRLNRFLIDARVPRSWRGRVPVVASPSQIVWIVGYRIDERVKVTAAASRILRLEFKPVA
jgi:tRNA(Ile)-lysidine synthase